MKKLLTRKLYYSLVILFTLASIIYSIFGKNGILQMKRLREELSRIQKDIDTINSENQTLRNHSNALKTDKRAVERVAKEELGMVRKDEILIRFKKR